MFSRRSFLKMIGIGAAALSAGYGTGKFVRIESERFSLNAFIPADDLIIRDIIKLVGKKCGAQSVVIFAETDLKNKLKKLIEFKGSYFGASLSVTLKKINDNINSDILLSDADKIIYDPSSDYDLSFTSLREKIKNRKASYLFSVEHTSRNPIADLLSADKKMLIIENEKGIQDQVSLTSYKNILLSGPAGKVSIKIQNGFVSVEKAFCRNKLCKIHGSISREGNTIACVPNNLLLRIDRV